MSFSLRAQLLGIILFFGAISPYVTYQIEVFSDKPPSIQARYFPLDRIIHLSSCLESNHYHSSRGITIHFHQKCIAFLS